ncbi:MAG: type II toxin-antitoxin system RelE family toxin [Eisenbergiella sp.]
MEENGNKPGISMESVMAELGIREEDLESAGGCGNRMSWSIEFLEEARKDMKKLERSASIQVLKGIQKVSINPLPVQEGGYGKPLGNKSGINLTNLLKIKFRDLGIRVVYKVERTENAMKIIVISARTDEQVYREASKRREKYEL